MSKRSIRKRSVRTQRGAHATSKFASALSLIGSVAVASAGPASATVCSPNGGERGDGHYYAGQAMNGTIEGDYQYAGVEGNLSLESIGKNGANFEINWLDVASGWCNEAGGRCWIQAGYGLGTVGGYQSPGSGVKGYMEEWNCNGDLVNLTTAMRFSP